MSNLRAKTCCFTGHRDIPESEIPGIKERAKRGIRLLYNNGVRFFGVGGALGFDTLMAQLLFRLRKDELKDIKVILVYPFEGFTSQWNDEQKRLYSRLLPYYDKVVSVARRGSREAYLARNRYLVDHSAYCIAYCAKNAGGTAYTLKYAEKQGLRTFNIALKQQEWRSGR